MSRKSKEMIKMEADRVVLKEKKAKLESEIYKVNVEIELLDGYIGVTDERKKISKD